MTEYQARTLGERVRHYEATENNTPKPGEGTEMKTIYGPGGQDEGSTGREGKEYTPPKGWSLAKPPKPREGETPEDKKAEKKTTAKNREVDRIDSVMKTDETLAAGNPGKMALVDKKKEYMSSLLNWDRSTVEDAKIKMKEWAKKGVTIDDETRLIYLKANGNNVKKAKAAAEADGWRI